MVGALTTSPQDRKNGPDDPVDVQVGRAVHGIEAHHILCAGAVLGQVERLSHLFRNQGAREAGRVQRPHHRFVSPEVELLDRLALDIRLPSGAKLADEGRPPELPGDHRAGQPQLAQQDREVARVGTSRFTDMLVQREGDFAHGCP